METEICNEPARRGDEADVVARKPHVATVQGVRGQGLFAAAERLLTAFDRACGRWLADTHNPIAQAGAAANVALLIAVASGVLLLLWYSPSLQFAYGSLAALTPRSAGNWTRAVHRYSSDLAVLFIVIHALRLFVTQKFIGARWLAWVSGIGMLGLVWFIGWTGYWLVWDQAAQQVAVMSMRLLDALPIFGEPLGRLYVSDRTVPSLMFFVVFFLHMLLPLAITVALAVHLARVGKAKLLPPRSVTLGLLAGLAVAAWAFAAPLNPPARMAEVAESFAVDAWYTWPTALALRLSDAGLWCALFAAVAIPTSVPWVFGCRRKIVASDPAPADAHRPARPLMKAVPGRVKARPAEGATARWSASGGVVLGATVALLVSLAVALSLLRIENPASDEPALVFTFKTFGNMSDAPALDPAAEAAKPVHMRGRSAAKPHREDVLVRLQVDGVAHERSFRAKGISRDGPAIGEWRVPLGPGKRLIRIMIRTGAEADPLTWEGVVDAQSRRTVVLTYEPGAGFRRE